MSRTFLIAGGDQRMRYTAGRLAENKDNRVILTWNGCSNSVPDNVIYKKTLYDEDIRADYIILPAPVSADGEILNMPFSEEKIMISSLMPFIRNGGIIFAGKMEENVKKLFDSYGVEAVDYLKCEEFNIMNAVPTAEGAVRIALEEMSSVLFGSSVLVAGFGRIAKILVKLLRPFGTDIMVAARKQSDLTWAEIYGCNSIDIRDIKKYASEFNLVFNTVPAMVIDRSILENINKECPVIDLASRPGGVDFTAASELGVKVIWALGIPGKTAPVTAGEIIADTVNNLINERSKLYE